MMFILLEYRYFRKKIDLMICDIDKKRNVFQILDKAKSDIKSYFVIKACIS